MSYAARRDYMKAYQLRWKKARRDDFFKDKTCADCGTKENLELDHDVKADKIDHKVWSWSIPRRNAEIAKCTIRCRSCHHKRHGKERQQHGTRRRYEAGCRCEPCCAKGRIVNQKRYALLRNNPERWERFKQKARETRKRKDE